MAAQVLDLPEGGGYARLAKEIRAPDGWILWKYVPVPGKKPRKMPYYTNGSPRRGVQGSADDRAMLSSFESARRVYLRGGWDGLGLAMLPDWNLTALDFDNCVDEQGRVDPQVLEWVGITYAELSPSGRGVRAFMRGQLLSRKSLDRKPNLETFSNSGFVTVTGRVLPEVELTGSADVVCDLTPGVLALYEERFGAGAAARGSPSAPAGEATSVVVEFDETALSTSSSILHDLDADRIESLLGVIDPDESYDTWLKVGMALHHQFEGGDAGFALWDTWSSAGAKYVDRADLETRWEGFGRGGAAPGGRGPITARWLLRVAKEKSARLPYEAAAEWSVKLAEAVDEFTLREKLCPEVRKDLRLGELERGKLAMVVQTRLLALGVKYRLPDCRAMVTRHEVAKVGGPGPKPNWLKSWVYVTSHDRFFKIGSEESLTMQGFCAKYNREIPPGVDGYRVPASTMAINEYKIPTVTKAMYVPWLEPMFAYEGTACVNMYRPGTVPQAAAELIPAGQAAIDMVRRHIEMLCGGRRKQVELLLSWMAHNVQRPGVRIRFVPLIKGVEGDGKSLLGTLMASVMGRANVKDISPKVINTDFNGWAVDSALGVLEEIKLTGHNRHDVLNALKPLITNDTIAVHKKHVNEYNSLNTQNYIAFTNHHDALPLGETDRRWWILFTPFSSMAGVAAAVKGDPASYFARLHMAIADHGPSLRRWLLDFPIVPAFDPNGPAPDTDEKQAMVASGLGEAEENIRDLITKGGIGVSSVVLSTTCLLQLSELASFDQDLPDPREISRALGRLGMCKCRVRPWWRGAHHRVWVSGREFVTADKDKLCELLETTLLAI